MSNRVSLRQIMRLLFILFLFLGSPSALTREYHLCVLTDDEIGNVRLMDPDDQHNNTVKADAETEYCEASCSSICSATDFNADLCGGQLEQRLTPYDDFRSRTICEGKKASTVATTITARVAKSFPSGIQGATAVIDSANKLLEANQCPLLFKYDSPLPLLPPAFDTLKIDEATQLNRFAHYPGKFKFVEKIGYCERTKATFSLDHDGNELIWSCAAPTYGSALISYQPVQISAILLLRTYAQLAEVGFENTGTALTLLDPDLFIPISPLLEGKMQQFHISKSQCIQLLRYAKRDNELHRVKQ
jgi:hypothetical protein